MNKKVCVSGASGYIGQQLVQTLLSYGFEVNILTRKRNYHLKNVKTFIGDVTNSEHDFSKFFAGAELFINCIGENYDETKMYDVHVTGTDNLAKYFNIKHWIQLSSIAVYGDIRNGIISEEHKKNPVTVYQKTRKLCEERLIYHSKNKGFNFTILRPSKIIGKNSSDHSIFLLEKYISLKLFFYIGSKNASFNYISDKNVINALILCVTNKNSKNKIYNISDHIYLETAVDTIKKIKKIKNRSFSLPLSFVFILVSFLQVIPKFPISIRQIKGLTTQAVFSISKIKGDLGYSNKIKIVDVLQEIIDE